MEYLSLFWSGNSLHAQSDPPLYDPPLYDPPVSQANLDDINLDDINLDDVMRIYQQLFHDEKLPNEKIARENLEWRGGNLYLSESADKERKKVLLIRGEHDGRRAC